jgi:hypothetical protein
MLDTIASINRLAHSVVREDYLLFFERVLLVEGDRNVCLIFSGLQVVIVASGIICLLIHDQGEIVHSTIASELVGAVGNESHLDDVRGHVSAIINGIL